ncbi:hypothetical protein ACOME3_005921 [Neoechinorhynchus agilis]
MADLVFRRGEFVYCEDDTKLDTPWTIRRIDSIISDSCGAFSVRAVRCYRTHDLPSHLIRRLDQKTNPAVNDGVAPDPLSSNSSCEMLSRIRCQNMCLSPDQYRQIQFREVYPSKQIDTIAGSSLRGKCRVFRFLEEVESLESYLEQDNVYLFRIGYNPEKLDFEPCGNVIRVGSKYQVSVLPEVGSKDDDDEDEGCTALWLNEEAESKGCTQPDVDAVVKGIHSCGMFDRSLCQSATTSPALMLTPTDLDFTKRKQQVSDLFRCLCQSTRDISVQRAHNIIHECNYDLKRVFLRIFKFGDERDFYDQFEQFSPSEISLFEEGLLKFGRNFSKIRSSLLPYKSTSDLVELYYGYKSTDRYMRLKSSLTRSNHQSSSYGGCEKTRQFLVLTQRPTNPHRIFGILPNQSCQSCGIRDANSWYKANGHGTLCHGCYVFLRQYGHLRTAIDFERVPAPEEPITCPECGKVSRSLDVARRHMMISHCRPNPSDTATTNGRLNFWFMPTEKTRAFRAIDPINLRFRNGLANFASRLEQKSYDEMQAVLNANSLDTITRAVVAYEEPRPPAPISTNVLNLSVQRALSQGASGESICTDFRRREPFRHLLEIGKREFDAFFHSKASEIEERETVDLRPRMRLLPSRTTQAGGGGGGAIETSVPVKTHGIHRSLLSDIEHMEAHQVENLAAILSGWVDLVDGPFFIITPEQQQTRRVLDKQTARLCARAPHLPTI